MGTEKARATAQGFQVQGSSEEKAYSAILLETKTEEDVFHDSDSLRLRECDYHSAVDLGETKESCFFR